jgi:hypothetical protein
MARERHYIHVGGWSGIVFSVGLLIEAGMVSLPTAALSGEELQAFYAAHRQIIIIQQIVAVALLVPLLAFARTLDRRSQSGDGRSVGWVMLAAWAVAAAELATNALSLVLAVSADVSAGTAHTLAFAGDLADAALFAAIALFSVVAAPTDWMWLRRVGVLVAALTLVRALASPIGVTSLDAVAPIAFLAYVLALSTRTILLDRARHTADRRPSGN